MSLHASAWAQGMEVVISAMGASIVKLIVPDAKGRKADVVLGYDEVEQYVVGGMQNNGGHAGSSAPCSPMQPLRYPHDACHRHARAIACLPCGIHDHAPQRQAGLSSRPQKPALA